MTAWFNHENLTILLCSEETNLLLGTKLTFFTFSFSLHKLYEKKDFYLLWSIAPLLVFYKEI